MDMESVFTMNFSKEQEITIRGICVPRTYKTNSYENSESK